MVSFFSHFFVKLLFLFKITYLLNCSNFQYCESCFSLIEENKLILIESLESLLPVRKMKIERDV